tara:strand:+ start:231 stop:830 length:600 start_codon:yes stop_codon:yes gene_type:complete
MAKKPEEETTPQNPVVEEVKEVKEEASTVETQEDSISKDDLADLRSKAAASSQNFERAKKAEEEAKNLKDELQDNQVLPTVDTEEESELKSEIATLKARANKSDVIDRYPEMKEVWDKFEEFRTDPENKGMNMNTAAKVFRTENGLASPTRKGLEKQTGGDRVQISTNNKMTPDEAKKLRDTDWKKYREMLKKGQINVE